jgi:hypothetical protein
VDQVLGASDKEQYGRSYRRLIVLACVQSLYIFGDAVGAHLMHVTILGDVVNAHRFTYDSS